VCVILRVYEYQDRTGGVESELSSTEEIMGVYAEDICRMTDKVTARCPLALYDGLDSVQGVYPDEFVDICEATRLADLDAAEQAPALMGDKRGADRLARGAGAARRRVIPEIMPPRPVKSA
jgi:hypothetical protein